MNIYVANLDYKVQDETLQELFEEYGAVESAKIVKDRETGRSRGFGFVLMPNDDEARQAIDGINGRELNGRSVTVNEAKPREDRPARPRNSFGGGGGGGNRGGGRDSGNRFNRDSNRDSRGDKGYNRY